MWRNDICGIYKILNTVNGKVYIGQSKHIKQRWSEHKKELRANRHPNSHLQRSWNKYGEESFQHIILEECEENILDEREKYYIEIYDSFDSDNGYNLTDGGGSNRDISESTRKKLSNSISGEMHPRRKEVICLETGEVFVSLVEAARSVGCDYSAITRCCNGITTTVKCLHWLFYDDYLKLSEGETSLILSKHSSKQRSVIYLNTNEYFPSIKDAHKATGINANSIGQCCLGNRKNAGKTESGEPRVFMYYDEYVNTKASQ